MMLVQPENQYTLVCRCNEYSSVILCEKVFDVLKKVFPKITSYSKCGKNVIE